MSPVLGPSASGLQRTGRKEPQGVRGGAGSTVPWGVLEDTGALGSSGWGHIIRCLGLRKELGRWCRVAV